MKEIKKLKKLWYIAFFVAAIMDAFVLDRIFKYLAINNLEQDVAVIPDFFTFTLQHNTGIAFSIGLPYTLQLLITPALLLIGGYMIMKTFKTDSLFVMIVSGLIVGGALGNYFDRIFYGHVVDYVGIWKYPVFNLADVFITVGIFLFVVFYGKISRTN